ncbi:hypothetical protein [Nocardia arthritidis]|uniref:Secreted protein n=1 Tax=Nocardia arthritidis TaxID=228602 RepID=A0A6G9YNE7_9NOCA|nr:hypothetical protein [Nocardia arthritidis]QIS14650.1 hypothetical protein F5544_34075 [Nocardia arthritidis]
MMRKPLVAGAIAGAVFAGVCAVGTASATEQIVGHFSGRDGRTQCNQAAKGYPPGVATCSLLHGDVYTLNVDWDKQGKPGSRPSTGSAGSS